MKSYGSSVETADYHPWVRETLNQLQKWNEQNQKWDKKLTEIRRIDKHFDSTLGALGSR
jgi:hypothetical protein